MVVSGGQGWSVVVRGSQWWSGVVRGGQGWSVLNVVSCDGQWVEAMCVLTAVSWVDAGGYRAARPVSWPTRVCPS